MDSLHDVLTRLKGQRVVIGPTTGKSVTGTLSDLGMDYLTVVTDQRGDVHVARHFIVWVREVTD